MDDPLKDLPVSLLVKLGSIIAHTQELRAPHGDPVFDGAAIDGLMLDPDVIAWLEAMRKQAFLPVPRHVNRPPKRR